MYNIQCMIELPIFKGLSTEEKFNLLKFTHQKSLQKGEILFYEQEPVKAIYLIKKGRIKLSKIFRNGNEITIGFRDTNQILGEEALFEDYRHNSTATALKESFICICAKEDFEMIIQKNSKLAIKIIKNLGKRLQQTTSKVSNLASQNVKGRLKFLFSQLAKEYGQKTQKGIFINLNLTHQDIADLIGASRVMVSKVLGEIDEISAERGEIFIKNTDDI